MASNDVLSAILHYKRNIDKISDPPERALKYEDRLLHCINRLYKLPVNVNHLQETGIGRTVNALRKIEGEKGLGDAAKALVAKWKTMVMLEDEAERKQREEPATGPVEDDIKKIKLDKEVEKSHQKKTDDNAKSPKKHHSENHKSKSHEENRLHKSESSNVGKDRKRKLQEESGHHSKHKKKLNNPDENDNTVESTSHDKCSPSHVTTKSSSSSSSSSSLLLSSSSKHPSKNNEKVSSNSSEKHDKKKEHKSSSSSSSSKHKSSHNVSLSSSNSNHDKKSKILTNGDAGTDGIDSQSGASFADALGPMIVKKSKKKISQSTANVSRAQSEITNESTQKKERKPNKVDIKPPHSELKPLEQDLVATLPVPTPYYKPNPIHNLPPVEASRRRIQAEEDALNTIMSNKNQRTKVYSGVKGGLTYVPTLYEFCCRVLQQHLDAIEYTGGIPYSLLKPVLDGATPAQLFQFEHFNPYIIEDTDKLWEFHVNKEFRNKSRQELETWRDMYLRCIDEREEKYKAVTANIQKSIEQSAPARKAKLAYIDIAKPPRNILRKQVKNGTSKPEASRLLGKYNPEAVRVPAPKQPNVKEPPPMKVKPKIAPLMQKTLKSIKMTRFKR